jgi:hypothetical protein
MTFRRPICGSPANSSNFIEDDQQEPQKASTTAQELDNAGEVLRSPAMAGKEAVERRCFCPERRSRAG